MDKNELENLKSRSFYIMLKGITYLIVGGGLTSLFLWIFINAADMITRAVTVPFLICVTSILLEGIFNFLRWLNIKKTIVTIENGGFFDGIEFREKNQKYKSFVISSKTTYMISFFIYLIGFLIVLDYFAIKNWSEDGALLFFISLIIWITILVVVIVMIKVSKQNKSRTSLK